MHAEIAGLTSRETENTSEEMLLAIGDSMSDLASADDGEDGKDEDHEQTERCKLSEDDEPGWEMGAITKNVLQSMERFRQKQMKLEEPTPPAWEDPAYYIREREMKYSRTELTVPAVVLLQTNDDASGSPPTTFG